MKIALKNDRVERVEALMLVMARAFNANLAGLQKGVKEVQEAQELFYETFMSRTLQGRFKRFVRWLGKN
jgi:hypothetical protein